MTDDAVPLVRAAVRALLTSAVAEGFLATGELAVAVSGGPDSLALAAATGYVAPRLGLVVAGVAEQDKGVGGR